MCWQLTYGGNTPSLLIGIKSFMILSHTESVSSKWDVGGAGKGLSPSLLTALQKLLLILAGDVETYLGPANGKQW